MDTQSEKKKDQDAIMKVVEKEKPKDSGINKEMEAEASNSASDLQQQTAVLKTIHGNIYHIWILILFLLRGPKLGLRLDPKLNPKLAKFKLSREQPKAGLFGDIVFEYTEEKT